MKVVLLAGGFGTRISEESHLKPKPMIEIGDKPILWHIMKTYSHYGFNDFIVCLGYKGYSIKDYFANYFLHESDVTFSYKNDSNNRTHHGNTAEPWTVTLAETGANTMTGGRIKRVKKYIGNEPFLLTYGDGVSDVNIEELIKEHKESKKLITVTATQPVGRFGSLDIKDNDVKGFLEKPKTDGSWINAGFFVCQPEVFDYIEGDKTIFEKEPLETLAKELQFNAYKHKGFWQPMDTLRDRMYLEELWATSDAPWKVW